MGSAGRSSGGGGSTTDYPEYQKNIQANWLAGMRSHTDTASQEMLNPGNDITSLVNLAVMNNPYEGTLAFDPAGQTDQLITAANTYLPRLRNQIIAYLEYLYEARDEFVIGFDIDELIDDQSLNWLLLAEQEYSDEVQPKRYMIDNSLDEADYYVRSMDTIETVENELAQFDSNMREINAVHGSAFLIGRQIIASGLLEFKGRVRAELATRKDQKALTITELEERKQARLLEARTGRAQALHEKAKLISMLKAEKAKFQATMISDAHKVIFPSTTSAVGDASRLQVEAYRMTLIALKEQTEENLRTDVKEALWEIETFQGAANIMASIAGGTVTTADDSPGKTQSAIAGGLSGAAAGAMIGGETGAVSGPVGAGIGAAIGIGASLF